MGGGGASRIGNSKIPLISESQIQNLALGNLGQEETQAMSCPTASFTEEPEIPELKESTLRSQTTERPAFQNQVQWPSHCALITFLPLKTTLLII